MKPPFPYGAIVEFSPQSNAFFLSNFYPCRIPYDGITYPTTEHAYQAAKSLDVEDRMRIMRQPTPQQAKKAGGQVQLRPDWNTVKIQIMRDILKLKFAPDSVLAGKLRFTKDVELIEGNYWHDLIWGQCHCKRHNWEGNNQLGKLLMEIRSELERDATARGQSGVSAP